MANYTEHPYAGEVERRTSRENGKLVVVLDRAHGGDWIDADERWVLLCDEHSTTCAFPTRRDAFEFIPVPTEWCEACRDD